MEYPKLLIKTKLIRPIELSIGKARETLEHLDATLPDVLLQGAFVMNVAFLEGGLSDCLKYLLTHFPEKIDKDLFTFSKDEFLASQHRLFEVVAEKHVTEMGFKGFREVLDRAMRLLSIQQNSDSWMEILESIAEIQATRNILLHNNLVVNEIYNQKSGSKSRADNSREMLSVDYTYVTQSISAMIKLQEELRELLLGKYHNYTRVAAMKKLWAFLFTSPIMPFDDFWHYDELKDSVYAYKISSHEHCLSSSETVLLGLWRSQFTDNTECIASFNIRRLDVHKQAKALFFVSMARDLDFEF